MIGFDSTTRFPGTAEILAGYDLGERFAVLTEGSGRIGLATAKPFRAQASKS